MPTGYTANIEEGISFREFALSCARAFGACLNFRDEPNDFKITNKFEPSPYYKDRAEGTLVELREIQSLSLQECELRERQALADESKMLREIKDKQLDLYKKYIYIRTQVENWKTPSIDHEPLKQFMIDQINDSIKFDCNNSYYEEKINQLTEKVINPKQWKIDRIRYLMDDYETYVNLYTQEVEKTRTSAIWIQQLNDSLPVD